FLWHKLLAQLGCEYAVYRMLRRLGLAEPDPRWAGLRLSTPGPEQLERPLTAVPRNVSNSVSDIAVNQPKHRLEAVPEGYAASGKVSDWLFEKSPYEDFSVHAHPDDLQGWGGSDPVLVGAIQLLRPARVCEVGSWKGRSAINMASIARDLHIDTEIVC